MPFFSVVIPLYNKEKQIGSTLKSVLNQSFNDFEVVIVNDGSTDESLTKVKSINDERIRILNRENAGASTARNKGIEQAKSEHIALVDADDFWENNHLEELKNSISRFPDAGLYCNAYSLRLSNDFTHKATYSLDTQEKITRIEDYFSASMINPLAMSSCVAFKKQDFQEIGQFNPDLHSVEDLDFWISFGLYKKVVFNRTYTSWYDKSVQNSLSQKDYRKDDFALFNSFRKEEQTRPTFRAYIDLNRYSLAVRCKLAGDGKLAQKLSSQIDRNNLNFKQKVLLASPGFLMGVLKQFQEFLMKRGIYLTAFK